MLHTDAFNKSNKRKMTKADYVKNTSMPGIFPETLDVCDFPLNLQPLLDHLLSVSTITLCSHLSSSLKIPPILSVKETRRSVSPLPLCLHQARFRHLLEPPLPV
jgi:hypothetical protein